MISKHWEDATGWKSSFEGLTFPADKKWTAGTIRFKGTRKKQKIKFEVTSENKVIAGDEFNLSDGEVKEYKFTINKCTAVNVSGYVKKVKLIYGAGVKVDVMLDYDKAIESLLSVSKTWKDETGGISCIENLGFGADHLWRKVQVTLVGKKNSSSGVMVSILADEELISTPGWKVLEGTETVVYEADINKKVPILVPGYITNHALVTGGGVNIKLTAFYREGE
ncbi:MAG: hypothetical protein E7214_11130 [Clostridium sp.]|nr:hypothetical protein [Clostridium sp.]